MKMFFILVSSLLLISCDNTKDDLIYYNCSMNDTSSNSQLLESKGILVKNGTSEKLVLHRAIDILKESNRSYTDSDIKKIKCSRRTKSWSHNIKLLGQVIKSKPPETLGGFIF